jgi:hypothetical protein
MCTCHYVWYNFHTQFQLLMYIYPHEFNMIHVHHSWIKRSLYLMDKIINDRIWYINVSIQYNMLYSSINMHANTIQNCSNIVCNEGTLKAINQWSINTILFLTHIDLLSLVLNPTQPKNWKWPTLLEIRNQWEQHWDPKEQIQWDTFAVYTMFCYL